MRIGELAKQAGVTTKTVRYYESVGLLDAARLSNGYRDYDDRDLRIVREVRTLNTLGIRVEQSKPFLECLVSGHERSDDCPDAITTYRAAITEFDERIADLTARRDAIAALMADASHRSTDDKEPLCQFQH